jgi:hypothetical protein
LLSVPIRSGATSSSWMDSAGLQLELDLGKRLALLACLHRSLVEGDVDLCAPECEPLRAPADPGCEYRG